MIKQRFICIFVIGALALLFALAAGLVVSYTALDHNPQGEFCNQGDSIDPCAIPDDNIFYFIYFLATSDEIIWGHLFPVVGTWMGSTFLVSGAVFSGIYWAGRTLRILSRHR